VATVVSALAGLLCVNNSHNRYHVRFAWGENAVFVKLAGSATLCCCCS
jgi:hypothetical protein